MKQKSQSDHRPRRTGSTNFHFSPSVCAAALAAGLLSISTISAQVVVAGWDTWVDSGGDNYTATVLNGATGNAVGTAVTFVDPNAYPGWANWTAATHNSGASIDGTWGTVVTSPAASTGTDGADAVGLLNKTPSGEMTFTVTNTSGDDMVLSGFHFDSVRVRTSGPNAWELSVLATSSITVGSVSSGTIISDNSTPFLDRQDVDIDLTGLADRTLADGEFVIFQLALTGGGGGAAAGGNNTMIDNVAVTSTPNTTDKLEITSVPANAISATDFSVTIQAQDSGGSPLLVTQNTDVSLAASGSGTLTGNTGTILAGTSTVTLNNVVYDVAEDITLTAIVTGGDVLLPSSASSTITIDVGIASQLVIETAADGSGVPIPEQTVLIGDNITVYAITRDAGGNFIENVLPVWSLENITGGIVQEDLFDQEDGSAFFDPLQAGTTTIRATFGALPVADSAVITASQLVNRYIAMGGNSNWQNPDNWLGNTLPNFDNQTDLFLYDDAITKRFTYLGADISARSFTFDEGVGQITISFVKAGNVLPANLTIDTDSEIDPATFTVTSDSVDTITLGYYGTTAAGRGVMILADDLLVTHDGTGDLIFNGDIQETDGPNGIIKAGTGTLEISGTNSYTGDTIVNGGVLRVTGNSIAGALAIDGGVVDVTGTEYVTSLQLGGGAVLTSGTYDATTDPTYISGTGSIVVGTPPGANAITITGITKVGTDATISFTSTTNVDVYRSSDLLDFGATPYAADQPSGTYTDTAASGDKFFYILVSAGDPAP